MSQGVLHLGAHRTGTTSLQKFLRQNWRFLTESGIDIVCPPQSRQMNLATLDFRCDRFVVSDENVLGTMENNIWTHSLYPDVVEQIGRYQALIEKTTTVYLSIRNYADWWNSAFSFCLANGVPLPCEDDIRVIASSQRGWCDVVDDLKSIFPNARIVIREFLWKTENAKQQLRNLTRWSEWSQTSIDKTSTNRRPSAAVLYKNMLEMGDAGSLKHLEGSSQIQLFSRSELELLNGRYLRDLAHLSSSKDLDFWCDLTEVERHIANSLGAHEIACSKNNATQTFCFLQFGKTGSDWISQGLSSGEGKEKLELGTVSDTLAHTAGTYGQHRKLAFVFRHPVVRFQAAFHSRVREGRPRFQADWTPAEAASFSYFETANAMAEALTSPDERLKSAARFAFRNIQHIKSTYAHFLHSSEALDFEHSAENVVFCCEDVDLMHHMQALFTLLGRPIPENVQELTDDAWEDGSLEDSLSELAMRNLQEFWASEFEIYEKCRVIAMNLGFASQDEPNLRTRK